MSGGTYGVTAGTMAIDLFLTHAGSPRPKLFQTMHTDFGDCYQPTCTVIVQPTCNGRVKGRSIAICYASSNYSIDLGLSSEHQ
jgi:hypothetical protein